MALEVLLLELDLFNNRCSTWRRRCWLGFNKLEVEEDRLDLEPAGTPIDPGGFKLFGWFCCRWKKIFMVIQFAERIHFLAPFVMPFNMA